MEPVHKTCVLSCVSGDLQVSNALICTDSCRVEKTCDKDDYCKKLFWYLLFSRH